MQLLLHAVVQRAVGDDAAQRCTAALRAQGVSAVVDWFVLETADEDLCRDLLSDVAAAEKLTRDGIDGPGLAAPPKQARHNKIQSATLMTLLTLNTQNILDVYILFIQIKL